MNETKQKAMPMKAITILIGVLVGVILGAHKVMFNPTDSRQYMLTLFANGMSENGVNVMLDPTVCEHSLSAWAANLIGDFNESCIACTLYDETGGRVETCDDVRSLATPGNSSDTSQLSLYVVPPEKWFVFPTMELGRAVAITRIEPPRGSGYPITVETLSHSPRAYHLHNFITESEADELISYALQNDDPVMGLQRSTTGAEHQVSHYTPPITANISNHSFYRFHSIKFEPVKMPLIVFHQQRGESRNVPSIYLECSLMMTR